MEVKKEFIDEEVNSNNNDDDNDAVKDVEADINQPGEKSKKNPPIIKYFEDESNKIAYGTKIVAFFDPSEQHLLYLKENDFFDCKFGHYKHESFVGKEYGSKILSSNGGNFWYAMAVDRAFYTSTLKHRTQILYSMDISMILVNLRIEPGVIVVESGTGSGSLTYSLSKAVGTWGGHVYSYEYNKERAAAAKEEFIHLGIENVTITNRDAYSEGFLFDKSENEIATPDLANNVDAIFLDLPSPWLAVDQWLKVIKKGGRLCNFSPWIEQIQKMISSLAKVGFADFNTIEALERPFERRQFKTGPRLTLSKEENEDLRRNQNYESNFVFAHSNDDGKWHTGYLTFCTKY